MSVMSENPFHAPQSVPPSSPKQGNTEYVHDGSGRSSVRQVNVIAWLMIVQGILILLFSAFAFVYAYYITHIDSFFDGATAKELQQQMPPEFRERYYWLFTVWGIIAAILAILHFWSAWLNFDLRGRLLGIVTMALGLTMLFSCWCAPTSIGLAIYGLIIYFQPAVVHAFHLRQSGMTKQQVLATFVR